ncbi:MAG TPA: right-handed parallel beta-helix repeat-containing protein [Patescibacteria group bacterium]|nr:right-handed parallel beta-helix repeat-containing protein [Patescibacteria group bacterium]
MADPVTWYTLARTIDDLETIQEKIDAKLLTHNLDPSAHGQTAESLWEHRVKPLLDHINYSIYNFKVNPAARVFKAIVAEGGEGDFRTIQEAIDYADLFGGGQVFIKAGTYDITSDLILYSNIQLIGEDDDTVILDFGESDAQVLIAGSVGNYKRNITLEKINFKDGENEDGLIWITYVDNVTIEGCKFTHSAATTTLNNGWIGITTNSSRIFVRRNRFLSGTNYIYLDAVNKLWILENYFYYSQRNGLVHGGGSHVIIRNNVFESMRQNVNYEGAIFFENNITNLHIEGNQFINCKGYVINFAGLTRAIIVDNRIDGIALTSYGIYLSYCVRCTISGNNFDNFDQSGIYLEDSDKNDIVANVITNCDGYGVWISNVGCDKNVVVGNVLTDNGLGGIRDDGAGTIKDHNAT